MSYTYKLVNKSAYLNDSGLIMHHINISKGKLKDDALSFEATGNTV